MKAERWNRVKELFEQAVGLESDARQAFLDGVCAGDPALRSEIESLVDFSDRPATVFETPVAEVLGELLPKATEPGRRFGVYRVERELGRGGMAVVYAAVRDDDQYRQQVAIKLIKRGMDSDAIVARFRQERQILANLQHPNIAGLLDGGVSDDGLPYLVMEHIEGEPIDVYCQHRELSVAERLRLFRKVCAAVHSAHQQLIVHRDLKPSNILVTAAGVPKLLDFGIAKLLAPEPVSDPALPTAAELRPMTPEFASPEQVRGEPVTTASDVYALGVLLYQLLTGRRPYRLSGLTPAEIEHVVCDQEPARPSTAVEVESPAGGGRRHRRRLAGDLDNIVTKAMHKQPDRRYGSAEQLAEDLRRHLEGMPVIARPDTLAYRAGKFVTRHRWGVTAASLIFLSLLAGIVATAWQAREASLQRVTAEWVADYLVDIFTVSHPGRDRGREVTARELLDRAAEGISSQVEDLPERLWGAQRQQVQAQLMDAIGRAYFKLGVYEEAAPRLSEALDIRRRTGAEDLVLAASLDHMGELLKEQSDFEPAEGRHREALALRRKRLGEQHELVAESLKHLAMVLYNQDRQDRFDHAEERLRQALAIERRVLGARHAEVATTLNDLALVLKNKGRPDDAEALYRQALAINRRSLGADRPDLEIATNLNNLALLLRDRGDFESAIELFEEALALEDQLLGADHLDLAVTQNNLAGCLRELGRFDDAERLFRASLELRRETLGPDHPDVAASLNNLAQVFSARGDLASAEVLFREALGIHRHAEALGNLAALLERRGEPAAAERLYREAVASHRQTLGDHHLDVATARHSLAELLRRAGQLDESELHFRAAWEVRRQILGDADEVAARSLFGLAVATSAKGPPERAEEVLRQCLELWLAQPAEVGRGRVAVLRSLLGGSLIASERYSEAEPMLLASYEVRRDSRTLKRIIELYQAWDRPEEAARYLALGK